MRYPLHYERFHTNKSSIDDFAIAKTIGFPVDDFKREVFFWCLVQLQRRILLGKPLRDDEIPCYLWQYGNHLVINCKSWNNPHPEPFDYDGSEQKLSTYKTMHPNAELDFERLTRLLINPYMSTGSIHIMDYAKQWDKLIQAQIDFQCNKEDATFKMLTQCMDAVRKLPF